MDMQMEEQVKKQTGNQAQRERHIGGEWIDIQTEEHKQTDRMNEQMDIQMEEQVKKQKGKQVERETHTLGENG